MADTAAPRKSLFQRLASPTMMLALGVFDTVLGLVYLGQAKTRGQAVFLIGAGVLLLAAGLFIRRGEKRRALGLGRPRGRAVSTGSGSGSRPVPMRRRKRGEPEGPKKPATARDLSGLRAKGPKAGAGRKGAGPTRVKPEDTARPPSRFRKALRIEEPPAPKR